MSHFAFDGDPASDNIFTATLLVDSVRVYSRPVVYLPQVSLDLESS